MKQPNNFAFYYTIISDIQPEDKQKILKDEEILLV